MENSALQRKATGQKYAKQFYTGPSIYSLYTCIYALTQSHLSVFYGDAVC